MKKMDFSGNKILIQFLRINNYSNKKDPHVFNSPNLRFCICVVLLISTSERHSAQHRPAHHG